MAIYHLNAAVFARSKGQSSTAAAAYRAGVRIVDERTGQVHDYTRRGGVVSAALILPGGGTADRADFWNRLEQHHRRGDAVVAREIEVSLPFELDPAQRERLAREYARDLADRYGVACDVAIHEPHKKGGDERNVHAHILISACTVEADGTLGKKCTALDPVATKCENAARAKRGESPLPMPIEAERERWAARCNRALAEAGQVARVDHRSLADQARDHLARGDYDLAATVTRTPTVHEGKATTAARRQGHVLDRAAMNDGIRLDNRRGLDQYLKEAGREGRVMATQQRVDDVTGAPVKRRQHPGAPVAPDLAAAARGQGGGALHVDRGQAVKAAKGPGTGKSKEQKHEEQRQAEAAALTQQWLDAQQALSEQYLEALRGAMADERKISEITSEIQGRLRAMGVKAARREAREEFKAEQARWQPRRRHMEEVVHMVKRGGEVRDQQRRQKRARMRARDGAGVAAHYDDKIRTWEADNPQPSRLRPKARGQWDENPDRNRWLEKKRRAEKAERDARAVMVTDAELRDLDLQASVIAQEMERLEAERRAKWSVASDWAQATVAQRFPERKPDRPTPPSIVTPAALEEARRRRPGLRPPGSRGSRP